MKSIEEILVNLTEDERKEHQDIIDECLLREASLNESKEKMQETKEKFSVLTQKLANDIEIFNELFVKINQISKELNDKVNTINLMNIPDDKFFHS